MHDQLAQRSAVQYDPFTEAQQADVQDQAHHATLVDDEQAKLSAQQAKLAAVVAAKAAAGAITQQKVRVAKASLAEYERKVKTLNQNFNSVR